jgi:hypothetical protein
LSIGGIIFLGFILAIFVIICIKAFRGFKAFTPLDIPENYSKHMKCSFNQATYNEIKILSGELRYELWGDLVKDIEQLIIEKGTKVEIICGPDFFIQNFKFLALAKIGKLNLYKYRRHPDEPHYTILGEELAFYHTPKPKGTQDEKLAGVDYDSATIKIFKKDFEDTKRKSKLIRGDNVFDEFNFYYYEPRREATQKEIDEMRRDIENYINTKWR